MTPDELIQTRIEEQKSSDPLIRAKAEDRLLGFYKQVAETRPGTAINHYRRIKAFYRANYVALQCTDPGYTIQREQDYFPTKAEIRHLCELVSLDAKAYILTLAESCGRPGAVAELQWSDVRGEINIEIVPCVVWLQHKVKLSRKKYFSFICGDAKDALKLLIQQKKKLLPTTRVFNKGYVALQREIRKAATKLGITDPEDKLPAFRPHCLRKRDRHYWRGLMCH